jgi:signal transduction histidine kinase
LKTPLTALGLQLQLIQREAAELSAHGASQRLAGLSSQALVATKRLGTLLDELLDLTRIREGRLEIRKQLCSLTGIIQDSVAILGAEAARRGIAILIEDAGPAMGMYDAGRVSQVMVNLLSNALKYGEGKPIHISIMQAEESAMVNVRDLGKGISEEVLPRIFQRYERFENDPSIPGLGLGLYISYEIVKAQGGSLSVESRVQEGSTFTMKLPVC